MKKMKIILSGGGTGGHIYPAVAVAQQLEKLLGDDVSLLFVGAEGKMEAEKIPALGYKIKCVPVVGIQRKLSFRNFKLPFMIIKSIKKAKAIIREFEPDVIAGFGGYASGPVLWGAQRLKLPTLIQEQNSYAGVTNKILGKRADLICVAYEHMGRFFPAEKIVFTGNPLRGNFSGIETKRADALEYFGLSADKPVLLVVGGSLGTRTLNEMMKHRLGEIVEKDEMQVIWQTGKYYEKEINDFMEGRNNNGIWRGAFIERMDYAYAAADVVISRSGANTVSELSLVGKPTIFVPSPNVSEDHQSKNAMAFVVKDAAIMIPDKDAVESAIPAVKKLLANPHRLEELARNMKSLAITDSAERIAQLIVELARKQKQKK